MLYIGAWFINFIEEGHLILYDADNIVNVTSMAVDKFVFLLQDLLNKFLMVRTQVVRVFPILALQHVVGENVFAQLVQLDDILALAALLCVGSMK